MKYGFLKFMLCSAILLGIQQFAMGATCTSWTMNSIAVSNGQILQGFAGDPCTDYGVTFSNFQVYINSGFASSPNTAMFSINVDFLPGGVIHFGSNMIAGEDIDVEFAISPSISGIVLQLVSAGPGSGVTETICSKQFTNTTSCEGVGGTVLGAGSVTGGVGGNTISSIGISPSPTGTDWIFKDVSGTSGFNQQITPEPLSFSLMGLGLLALGLIRRKRRP